MWRLLSREDVREHPIQVLFIVAILLATLVLPAVVAGVSTLRRVQATADVTGTILRVDLMTNRRSTTYLHTYEYRFEGTPYRDTFGQRGVRLEPGDAVPLVLDPAAPQRAYRSRELPRGAFVLLYLFWGVAALLLRMRGLPSGKQLLHPRHAWAFALVFSAPVLLFLPITLLPANGWLIPAVYLSVLPVTALLLQLGTSRSPVPDGPPVERPHADERKARGRKHR